MIASLKVFLIFTGKSTQIVDQSRCKRAERTSAAPQFLESLYMNPRLTLIYIRWLWFPGEYTIAVSFPFCFLFSAACRIQENSPHFLPIVVLRTFLQQDHLLVKNIQGLSDTFAEPKHAEQDACPAVGFCCVSEILKVDLYANDLSKMFTY